MENRGILVVRLSAMGDVIHTIPAAATLKHSFAGCHLAWVVDPKWAVLLEGNPYVDEIVPFDRRKLGSYWATRKRLRAARFDAVFDFQGLFKSAIVAQAARPEAIHGFHQSHLREPLAALFYSHRVKVSAKHVVDRNIELAAAAGASNVVKSFPLPAGAPEGELPGGPFVLASPLGGWRSKQWPLEHYGRLAELLRAELGLPLVLNGAPADEAAFGRLKNCRTHLSSVTGLIDATRRATAVVGIDSGPMHLAAGLGKPGVAIFGPTDPARNGPYAGSFTVIRDPVAVTTYKRDPEIALCMKRVTPETVFAALAERLEQREAAEGGAD